MIEDPSNRQRRDCRNQYAPRLTIFKSVGADRRCRYPCVVTCSVPVAVLVVSLLAASVPSQAQDTNMYVGGSLYVVNQGSSNNEPLGGATWGAAAAVGVRVSDRVSLEFEPTFSGAYSNQFSYRFTPVLTADETAVRRDTSFSGQLRLRASVIEPVIGLSYIHGAVSRHATVLGRPYFDDAGSDDRSALVGGIDVPLKVASRFYIVPSVRVLFSLFGGPTSDPLFSQTATGDVTVRIGAGARFDFHNRPK